MQNKKHHQIPISIDLANDPSLTLTLSERQSMEQMIADGQDFIMLQMETINEDEAPEKEEDEHEDDETEVIVNVYETTHRYVLVQNDGNLKNDDGSQKIKTTPISEDDLEKLPKNATVELINECPKGTFDCFANGLQCIPNYLR